MSAIRAVMRFFADWRNAATFLGSVVIALLIVITVEGVRARNQAATALQAQADQATQLRTASSRRIDKLNDELRDVRSDFAEAEAQRGRLSAALDALAEQIRQMGGRPVATSSNGDSVRPAPSSSARTSPRPGASPTRSASPRPTSTPRPSPSPTCRVVAPVVGCVR